MIAGGDFFRLHHEILVLRGWMRSTKLSFPKTVGACAKRERMSVPPHPFAKAFLRCVLVCFRLACLAIDPVLSRRPTDQDV